MTTNLHLIHLSNSIITFLVTLHFAQSLSHSLTDICIRRLLSSKNRNRIFCVPNVLSMTSEEIIQIEIRNLFIKFAIFRIDVVNSSKNKIFLEFSKRLKIVANKSKKLRFRLNHFPIIYPTQTPAPIISNLMNSICLRMWGD